MQFLLLCAFDTFGQGWLMSSLWVYRFSAPLHALCDCFYASTLLFCYSSFVTVCEICHSNASSYKSEVLVWLLIVQGDFEYLMSSDLTLLGLGLFVCVWKMWYFSWDQRHTSDLSCFGQSELLMLLILQIHEYRLSSYLPLSSQFFINVLQFLVLRNCKTCIKFISRDFIFVDAFNAINTI